MKITAQNVLDMINQGETLATIKQFALDELEEKCFATDYAIMKVKRNDKSERTEIKVLKISKHFCLQGNFISSFKPNKKGIELAHFTSTAKVTNLKENWKTFVKELGEKLKVFEEKWEFIFNMDNAEEMVKHEKYLGAINELKEIVWPYRP